MLALQGGESAAFERIVLHYQEGVRKFIGRYILDAERAEDLAQEAFLRVYRARQRYQPTARFRTWLFTITTRLCLNEIRGRKRERTALPLREAYPDPGASGESPWDPFGAIPDCSVETPLEKLEREELEAIIASAVEDLPANQRAAILLLRFEEAPYQEIAQILGISVMAVKSLINRARESLRRRLGLYLNGKPGVARPLRPLAGENGNGDSIF